MRQVIQEIIATDKKKEASRPGNIGNVCVVVKDDLTRYQLKDLLQFGEAHVMDARFRWFLSQQALEIRRKAQAKRVLATTRGGGSSGGKEFELKDHQVQELFATRDEVKEGEEMKKKKEKVSSA